MFILVIWDLNNCWWANETGFENNRFERLKGVGGDKNLFLRIVVINWIEENLYSLNE